MSHPKSLLIKNKLLKPLKPFNLPIFINKNNKITLVKGNESKELLLKHIQMTNSAAARAHMFKEDLIYKASVFEDVELNGEFLPSVSISNRLNLLTSSSRTIAKYANGNGEVKLEKTSDNVSRLIGQKHYDTVFSALCSVISQELKIRGILALLTLQKKFEDIATQTKEDRQVKVKIPAKYEDKCCQTEENSMDLIFKMKQKQKRLKRNALTPYVVKDLPVKAKKVVINPDKFEDRKIIEDLDDGIKCEVTDTSFVKKESISFETTDELIDIKPYLEEDSNEGSIGNLSAYSGYSNENLLNNPTLLLNNIDHHTENLQSEANKPMEPKILSSNYNPTYIQMLNGSQIKLPVKPEDHFHIATPEILRYVSNEEKMNLLWYQAYIDWKFCLQKDDDGNLPIHAAVMNNDLDLLRRQCLVLRNRQESLDMTAGNLTALQMSLSQDPKCTSMLLQYGADPLFTDDEHRTVLHLAAEAPTSDHLRAVIAYCQSNAMKVLRDHDDLCRVRADMTGEEELAQLLLDNMAKMIDDQGYTPLMLASNRGSHSNVKLLVEAAPSTVNMQMPNSGNTALYLAVAAACVDIAQRSHKRDVAKHYLKTIEILVENGANPNIDNHSGTNVNDLLTEFNVRELSMLIANKLTSFKYFDGEMPGGSKNFDSFMLVKDKEGTIKIKDVGSKNKNDQHNAKDKAVPTRNKQNSSHINVTGINNGGQVDSKEFILTMDKTTNVKVSKKPGKDTDKPIILENITLPKVPFKRDEVKLMPLRNATVKNFKLVSPKDKLVKLVHKQSLLTDNNIRNTVGRSVGQLSVSKGDKVAVQNHFYVNKMPNVFGIRKKNVVTTKRLRPAILVKGKKTLLKPEEVTLTDNSHDDSNNVAVDGKDPLEVKTETVQVINNILKRKSTQNMAGPSEKKVVL